MKFYGTSNPANKLSNEAVQFIRGNYQPGSPQFGVRNLARILRVHPKTVWNILNNRTWTNAA